MLARIFLICVGVLLVAQIQVYAYVDPGSGTLIWQILLAASFGVMFYLRRIIGWVRRLRSSGEEAKPADALGKGAEEKLDSVNGQVI
jgi:hypothetical protein